METKEIYGLGTKPENTIRVIGNRENKLPLDDIQILKRDLQWYQDEVVNLEKDIRDMEAELFDKEAEIEDLMDEIEELHEKIIAQPS